MRVTLAPIPGGLQTRGSSPVFESKGLPTAQFGYEGACGAECRKHAAQHCQDCADACDRRIPGDPLRWLHAQEVAGKLQSPGMPFPKMLRVAAQARPYLDWRWTGPAPCGRSPCPYQKPRSYGFWLMKSFHDSPNSLHWARTCSVAAFKRHKQSKRTTCPRPRGAKSGGCLGGDSFVAMMESAALWDLHDPTHGLRLDRTADGCVLAQ